MEQTPVEFLVELLNNLNDNFSLAFKEEINQANKMFEDQIINAYNDGSIDSLKNKLRLGRQYYRQTFNK
jgi:hypothetical protein